MNAIVKFAIVAAALSMAGGVIEFLMPNYMTGSVHDALVEFLSYIWMLNPIFPVATFFTAFGIIFTATMYALFFLMVYYIVELVSSQ